MKNCASENKSKRTCRFLNSKFFINKRFAYEATHYTRTNILLFVGNTEISRFLALSLNLLGSLTPSEEIKTFMKLIKQSGSHGSHLAQSLTNN